MNEKAIQNAMDVAKQAGLVLGVNNTKCIQVIAAQAIQEKGWNYWNDYPNVSEFNFWNVGQIDGKNLPTLSTMFAGTVVYGFTLLVANPNAYADYINNLRTGDWELALEALAKSPWANPPYGETLITLYDEIFKLSVPATSTSNEKTRSTYTVQNGQNLWVIAEQHGIPFQTLKALNPQIKNDNLIYPGEKIYLS
jgi:LysM repeat protein